MTLEVGSKPIYRDFCLNITSMKELKEYFSGIGQVKGYVFNQIKRTNKAYLYEVKGDDTIHYEVFKRVENSLYDCVSYPTDKAFGRWAWTCMTLEKANERFNSLNISEDGKTEKY